jgi:hypothetical protein
MDRKVSKDGDVKSGSKGGLSGTSRMKFLECVTQRRGLRCQRPEKGRGGAVGEMGKSKGCEEEGGVVSRGACYGEFAVGFCVWVRHSTLCVAKLLQSQYLPTVAAICDC